MGEPWNNFIVLDYASGDPGDVLVAGQREDTPTNATPELGAIGLLALGAVDLQAWRRREGDQPN